VVNVFEDHLNIYSVDNKRSFFFKKEIDPETGDLKFKNIAYREQDSYK
jgi:hypothetical protein